MVLKETITYKYTSMYRTVCVNGYRKTTYRFLRLGPGLSELAKPKLILSVFANHISSINPHIVSSLTERRI